MGLFDNNDNSSLQALLVKVQGDIVEIVDAIKELKIQMLDSHARDATQEDSIKDLEKHVLVLQTEVKMLVQQSNSIDITNVSGDIHGDLTGGDKFEEQ